MDATTGEVAIQGGLELTDHHGSDQRARQPDAYGAAGLAAPPSLDVTIVLPCLNEAMTLAHCIGNARSALQQLQADGLRGEIVVADNGSTDGSQDLARKLGARVVPVDRRGYGNALRGGIAAARGRYIVMGDCDGSYDFEEAAPMVRRLQEGYELCMGSRLRGRILPGAMPWKNRHIGNPVLTGILNLLFRSGLSDAHCGLRAFTRDAARRLNLSSEGMEFASEMVIKAALLNLKRTEVPITLHPDLRDRPPHLRPWRDGWRHLRFLFMLSPIGLFLIPSMVLSLFGTVILGLLLARPEGQAVVHLGPAWLGPHWLPFAGAALTLGHMLFLFGVGSEVHGVRAGYRRSAPLARPVRWLLTLEGSLTVGVGGILAGLAIISGIVGGWAGTDFGPLQRLPELMLGTILLTIGAQQVFGGFLLSVIADNRADFLPASGPPDQRS
ncbi:MAG: glycosyltransferase family 2 protein [Rhodospirillaceae bacterium]|nr:glycosyltransferase family 2 protein [Rhodospirillaceae bacterium]